MLSLHTIDANFSHCTLFLDHRDKNVSAARGRAEAQVCYHPTTQRLAGENSKSELTRLVQVKVCQFFSDAICPHPLIVAVYQRKQTDELQRASDLSIALGFAVGGLIKTVSLS